MKQRFRLRTSDPRDRREWGRSLPLSLIVLLAILLVSCQPRPSLDAPPEIRYGEDTCDLCHMIINEARFAAAYVTRQGEARRFDDIGDLLAYHAAHAEEVAAFWVHDYDTEEWLRAEQATFVVSDAFHTPMGHGIVAVADAARAQELAASTGGEVVSFSALLSRR
jgi:copper chaperone NosL